jgi:Pyruvate/2-oxoacid:ferredoxin oxidoreductase gamma subunit
MTCSGYDIKANPKYGSEKKGQPTTYYLAAAPEPIRINCEYFFVDVVLSPDPNVFQTHQCFSRSEKRWRVHHPK